MILITAKLKDLNDHLGLRRVRRCSSARGWLFSHWLLLHGTKEGQVVMVAVVVVVVVLIVVVVLAVVAVLILFMLKITVVVIEMPGMQVN